MWPFNNNIQVNKIEVINELEKPGVKSIEEMLNKVPIDRIRETLADWAIAVEEAENPTWPRRENLFNLYKNIELDDHIKALTDTILFQLTQTPYHIVDKTGEIDEEKTKLFQKSWFYDFCKYALESDYWGFSLLQFKSVINGTFSGVENVDRYFIRPENNGVVKDQFQDEPNIFYDKKPYSDWTFFVKGDALGRYNIIAKTFILKREVTQFWAVFNELFTTPHFYAKTNFNNAKHRNDLINFFSKRRHSGFSVFDLEDEINAISNGGQGWNSYEVFEKTRNEAMSKAFLGQTMVFEDGSSRSQAEVHERQMDSFIQARRVWLFYMINERLIPQMVNLGCNITLEDSFKWNLSQELTVKDYADIISKLANYFDFDEQEVSEKIGFQITKKEQMPVTSDEAIKKNFKKPTAEYVKQIYNQKL
jgi:hypothetical protein